MTPDYAAADEAFDAMQSTSVEKAATVFIRPRSTHYYTDRRNFCPHCGGEHLDPMPPLPTPATRGMRLRWLAFGIGIGMLWGFALWG